MPLEFLDAPQGVETAAPIAAVEPVAEPAPQDEAPAPADDPPRGPDGKFVAKDPATPEPAPEPVVAAEPPPAPEPAVPPGYVPLEALQAVREEVRTLKAQRQPAPQPAEPQAVPDRYEDPEGYEAWRDQQLENRLFDERCNVSERFARTQHGEELVDAAKQWAVGKLQADPLFNAALRGQPDPYGFAVAEYRKDKLFSEFKDDDFAAFQAWKASQGQPAPAEPAAPIPVAVAPLTPAPPAPPRSIATAPSAGGPAGVPIGPGVAYDAIFKR